MKSASLSVVCVVRDSGVLLCAGSSLKKKKKKKDKKQLVDDMDTSRTSTGRRGANVVVESTSSFVWGRMR